MKRILGSMACLGVLLCLWSCTTAPDPTETTDTAESTATSLPIQNTVISSEDSYTKTRLLSNVQQQKKLALFSVRSDGTVDYIFRKVYSATGALSFAGYQYYTISPDGTAEIQSTDWISRLDDAIRTLDEVSECEYKYTCELAFSSWEGDLLIHAQMLSLAEDMNDYTALYRVRDGELTQIPFRWEASYGEISGIYAMEDGFLVSACNGSLLRTYAYDGSQLSDIRADYPGMGTFLGMGGAVGWFWAIGAGTITAIDLRDGTILTGQLLNSQLIRCSAFTPDGSATYLLSSTYTTGRLQLDRISVDGVEALVTNPRYHSFGSTDTLPSHMAVSNDGTIYTITETGSGIQLLQYRMNQQKEEHHEKIQYSALPRPAASLYPSLHGDRSQQSV